MKVNLLIAALASIALLFFIISCKSGTSTNIEPLTGKATLIFRAPQQEITVKLHKPLDNMSNYQYVTDELVIKPNVSVNYELEVNDFAFVRCLFSNGKRASYLLFPGDCVEVICEPTEITVSGSNAEGHKYYMHYDIGSGVGTSGRYFSKMYNYLRATLPNYDSVYNFFWQELVLPYQADILEMELSGSITPKFSSILSKNIFLTQSALNFLSSYNLFDGHIGRQPTDEDHRNILLHTNKLYETLNAMSGDVNKMHMRTSTYYRLKYRYLDDEAKEKLAEGYDKEIFGIDHYLLLASDSIQLREFSTHLISDLNNKNIRPFYGHNQEALVAYLSSKFPDSEYVAIVKKLMAQLQSSSEISDEIIVFETSPSSIKELMQLPGIQGKYAYIDLWATWCPPCLAEFQYNDEVHKILAQYSNIVPVFISFDSSRDSWKDAMSHFNLKGYNILASAPLNEDIGIRVYNASATGNIPRYLLVDPDGNIVNDFMPRPSQNTMLGTVLNSVLQ